MLTEVEVGRNGWTVGEFLNVEPTDERASVTARLFK